MVIKGTCVIGGVQISAHVQSVCIVVPVQARLSANLIIYTLDVSIMDGIVKLQDAALGVKM